MTYITNNLIPMLHMHLLTAASYNYYSVQTRLRILFHSDNGVLELAMYLDVKLCVTLPTIVATNV